MADGFLNFMDMIDGGGAGDSGNEFQGGGLLSDIGNALFQPAGYRERQRRMSEVRPQMRPMDMGPQAQPMPSPQPMQSNPMASGMTPANAYVPPMPEYSTSGMNPGNAYVPQQPMQEYSTSGMTPANAYTGPDWMQMLQMLAEEQARQQFGRGGPRY